MPTRIKSPSIDCIQKLITDEIDKYRMSSFDTFGISISVSPTEDAEPIFNVEGVWLGFDEYDFETFRQKGKPMHVRTGSKGFLRVWHDQHWARLSSYLKHVKPILDCENNPGSLPKYQLQLVRLGQQSRWWMANGKKFRLMDLPLEIREIIYGFAFGERIEPYPRCKSRRLGRGRTLPIDRKPTSNLLYTCHQVYVEGSNILFKFTPFFVEHFGVSGRLMSKVPQRSRIRRLQLAFSHDDFFRFFGGKPGGYGTAGKPSSAARAMRGLELDKLELRIAAPSLNTDSQWLDGACNKTVVDRIFHVAWPWIRGHPVEITGLVKTSQKAAFEAACLKERHLFGLWQKQNLAVGGNADGLKEYDEWLKEMEGPDGGVRLEGDAAEGSRRG